MISKIPLKIKSFFNSIFNFLYKFLNTHLKYLVKHILIMNILDRSRIYILIAISLFILGILTMIFKVGFIVIEIKTYGVPKLNELLHELNTSLTSYRITTIYTNSVVKTILAIPLISITLLIAASFITGYSLGLRYRFIQKVFTENNIDLLDHPYVKEVLNLLDDKERQVMIEILRNRIVSQAELVKKLRIPKSTLSRILSRLENRKLIIRYREGITMKVKENISEKLKTNLQIKHHQRT